MKQNQFNMILAAVLAVGIVSSQSALGGVLCAIGAAIYVVRYFLEKI